MADHRDNVVEIYAAENAEAAFFLKNLLADEGIAAEVSNADLGMAAGGLPIGYPIAPRLWVPREHAETARAIVLAWEREHVAKLKSRAAWQCPACGRRVEAWSDECYNCGADRQGNLPEDDAGEPGESPAGPPEAPARVSWRVVLPAALLVALLGGLAVWLLSRREPTTVDALFDRAGRYMDQGEYERAIADYTEAIAKSPSNAAYYNRALAYFYLEDYEQAASDFTRAIRLFPEDAESHHWRAFCLHELGREELALADYRRAVVLDQANADYANNLAWLLATASDPKLRDGQEALRYATPAGRWSWPMRKHGTTSAPEPRRTPRPASSPKPSAGRRRPSSRPPRKSAPNAAGCSNSTSPAPATSRRPTTPRAGLRAVGELGEFPGDAASNQRQAAGAAQTWTGPPPQARARRLQWAPLPACAKQATPSSQSRSPMRVIVEPSPEAVAVRASRFVVDLIRRKPDCVLGLATGSTPLGLYKELIRLHCEEGLDFSRVTTFNLDEYVGLDPGHPQSYRYFMQTNLFDHVNLDRSRTHVPDGRALDFEAHSQQYEQRIRDAGGIDLQVLGIGTDGHIAFNEPGSSLGSRTRLKTLTPETIRDNARFFGDESQVPRLAVTVGVGTILESRRCLLLATGEHKARAIRDTIEGPVTAQVTGSALQLHRDVVAVIDENAAHLLERREYYRQMEEAQTHLEAERSRRQQQG